MIKQGRSFSGHERNCCFLNTGRERFATVSAVSGLDFADDARCLAVVDWDHDGDLDVWLANRNAPRLRFMRNDTPTDNHYLSLRLVGNGTTSNRDAIGARVEVILNSGESNRLIRTVRAGEGFLSQSSKWLHFGLGNAKSVEKVIVRWPGGAVEEYIGLRANGRYRLQQDSGRPLRVDTGERLLSLRPSTVETPSSSRVARIPLVTRLRMPSLSYTTLAGERRPLPFPSGTPVLVNLWASWCEPCVAELAEFARRENELRAAGIEIVALSVDRLGDEASSGEQAKTTLARLEFPFAAGYADDGLVNDLQDFHNHAVPMWRPLPIPTSYLIDGRSRLAVIYTGPVSVDDVLADARHVPGGYADRFERAACVPGRSVDHELVVKSAQQAETRTRFRIASSFHNAGRLSEAATSFLDLLEFQPDCEEAHEQLAVVFLRQGDFVQAAVHCRRALESDPNNPRLHNTMGNILSSKNPNQAIAHYARAIRITPDYAEAHNNIGTVYASQGKFAEAAGHFKRAIEISPDSAEALNNLGSVFAARGDLVQATARYEQAIRADPKYAEAYNNLGSMFARRGALKRAVEQYERALEINPDYGEARDNLKRAQAAFQSRQNLR